MIADPARRLDLFEEFKNFAFKGNVVDWPWCHYRWCVRQDHRSLVKQVIMPLISVILPGKGIRTGVDRESVRLGSSWRVVNFLIIALVLYIFIVKFLGSHEVEEREQRLRRFKDQELLTEIRDL